MCKVVLRVCCTEGCAFKEAQLKFKSLQLENIPVTHTGDMLLRTATTDYRFEAYRTLNESIERLQGLQIVKYSYCVNAKPSLKLLQFLTLSVKKSKIDLS
jgi:hypothetical protein